MEALPLPDRVAISGCNPFAVRLAFALAHRGVGAFTLVDPRVVTARDLLRIPIWPWSDLGRYRADALARALGEHFPALDVRACTTALTQPETIAQVAHCNLLVICDLGSTPRALLERLPSLRLYPLEGPPGGPARPRRWSHGSLASPRGNDALADDLLDYWRRRCPPPEGRIRAR